VLSRSRSHFWFAIRRTASSVHCGCLFFLSDLSPLRDRLLDFENFFFSLSPLCPSSTFFLRYRDRASCLPLFSPRRCGDSLASSFSRVFSLKVIFRLSVACAMMFRYALCFPLPLSSLRLHTLSVMVVFFFRKKYSFYPFLIPVETPSVCCSSPPRRFVWRFFFSKSPSR